jgi:signal transduction histidine kinase
MTRLRNRDVADFSVPNLVGTVAAIVRPLVEKNSKMLVVECNDDLDTMHVDFTKIRQALFNLLSNASNLPTTGRSRSPCRRSRMTG